MPNTCFAIAVWSPWVLVCPHRSIRKFFSFVHILGAFFFSCTCLSSLCLSLYITGCHRTTSPVSYGRKRVVGHSIFYLPSYRPPRLPPDVGDQFGDIISNSIAWLQLLATGSFSVGRKKAGPLRGVVHAWAFERRRGREHSDRTGISSRSPDFRPKDEKRWLQIVWLGNDRWNRCRLWTRQAMERWQSSSVSFNLWVFHRAERLIPWYW
jgi:hypothetical protein